MCRQALAFSAALLMAATAPVRVEAQAVDGLWKLTYLSGTTEMDLALVKLTSMDDKVTGDVIATAFTAREANTVRQEGNLLQIHLISGTTMDFEAVLPKMATKRMLGSLMIGKKTNTVPAWLTPSDQKKLSDDRRTHICPPMQEAIALLEKASKMKPGKMDAKAVEIAKKETPRLYREVLKDFPDDPVVFKAIIGLMKSAKENDVKVEEVAAWGKLAARLAKDYGPQFETGFAIQAGAIVKSCG